MTKQSEITDSILDQAFSSIKVGKTGLQKAMLLMTGTQMRGNQLKQEDFSNKGTGLLLSMVCIQVEQVGVFSSAI